MPPRCSQSISKHAVDRLSGRKSSRERVNRCPLDTAVQLFSQRDARAPAAGRAAVVSEPIRKVVLKIIRRRQVLAAAEYLDVAILIVERRHLQFPPAPP